MKHLRIATDVSRNHGHKETLTTYAVYIKYDNKRFKKAYKMKRPYNGYIAEVRALANGLFIADKLVDLSEYFVDIYNDQQGLLTYKTRKDNGEILKKHKSKAGFINKHLDPVLNKAVGYRVYEIKGHAEPQYKAQHALGAGHEAWQMHDWCDNASRDLMRITLAQLV